MFALNRDLFTNREYYALIS